MRRAAVSVPSNIVESLLTTLSAKQGLFTAVLDPDADVMSIDLTTGIDELKRRLEILLGARPEVPVDESLREDVEKETEQTVHLANTFKQRLSECLEPGENGELKMNITLPDEKGNSSYLSGFNENYLHVIIL